MESKGSLQYFSKLAIITYRAGLIQFTPFTPIFFRLILLLFSLHCLGLRKRLFLLALPAKILYEFIIYIMHATCPAHLILLDLIILIIFCETLKFWSSYYGIFSSCPPFLTSAPSSLTPSFAVFPLLRETKFHAHKQLHAKMQFAYFNIIVVESWHTQLLMPRT